MAGCFSGCGWLDGSERAQKLERLLFEQRLPLRGDQGVAILLRVAGVVALGGGFHSGREWGGQGLEAAHSFLLFCKALYIRVLQCFGVNAEFVHVADEVARRLFVILGFWRCIPVSEFEHARRERPRHFDGMA